MTTQMLQSAAANGEWGLGELGASGSESHVTSTCWLALGTRPRLEDSLQTSSWENAAWWCLEQL